jgi:hypothetical protein
MGANPEACVKDRKEGKMARPCRREGIAADKNFLPFHVRLARFLFLAGLTQGRRTNLFQPESGSKEKALQPGKV